MDEFDIESTLQNARTALKLTEKQHEQVLYNDCSPDRGEKHVNAQAGLQFPLSTCHPPRRPWQHLACLALSLATFLFATVSLLGFINIRHAFNSDRTTHQTASCSPVHQNPATDHPQDALAPAPALSTTLHCGNTTTEARSRSCRFQLWSYAWVPAPCFDPDMDAAYLRLQSPSTAPPQPDTAVRESAEADMDMSAWPASTTGWQYFLDRHGTRASRKSSTPRGCSTCGTARSHGARS